MNKKEILKKVGGILAELNEQYQYLLQSPENLNELELELFSANSNFLSDHLSILVKLNESKAKSAVANSREAENGYVYPKTEETEPTGGVTDHQLAHDESRGEAVSDRKLESQDKSMFNVDLKQDQPTEFYEQPLTNEERKVIDDNTRLKPITPEKEHDYSFNEKEESSYLTEDPTVEDSATFVEENVKEVVISERTVLISSEPVPHDSTVPTLNDLLSKNISQQTVSSQFNSRHSMDLKGMISLNDKLLFVRDLFNGYSLAYSEALELLNRFDNFEAADNFLKQNYAGKNNWVEKQDVRDKFYEVLSRRFSK